VNDEELVTLESKTRQHPFDYIGMEEAGKVWWFDFCTLWDWSIRSITPTNPYTNVELAHEVKQRLEEAMDSSTQEGNALDVRDIGSKRRSYLPQMDGCVPDLSFLWV
jgi:hypothetical protein